MKDKKYNIYYLPVFSLFIVIFLINTNYIHKLRIAKIRVSYLILLLICAVAFVSAYSDTEPVVNAYHDAATFVMANPKGTSIFFLGNYNGDFVYNIRTLDKDRDFFVLRGTIFLTSFDFYPSWGSYDFIDSKENILKLLNEMGVYYVVIEEPVPFLDPDNNNSKYPIFALFEKMLSSDDFTKIKSYDVAGYKSDLNIYRYNKFTPLTKETLTIPLYSIGKNITVRLKK